MPASLCVDRVIEPCAVYMCVNWDGHKKWFLFVTYALTVSLSTFYSQSSSTPPTAPPCPPVASNAAFRVTAAVPVLGCSGTPNPTDASPRATCFTNNSGLCFTDGPGIHGNNERCTMTALRSVYLTVPSNVAFDLENNWDYLRIGNTRYYTRASIEGVQVTAGTTISFFSDGSVINEGFTVCVR